MVAEPPLLLVIAIAQAKKPKDQAGMPLGIWRHTKAPHAFGYRGRLLAAYYHICDRQADGTFILEEEVQKKLVTNYPAFRKSRDAGHIYTTKGARQAAPRLFKNRRDEKGKFRKAFASEQGQELSKYGIEKTLLQTYDMNKASKAWLAGADKHQKSRLSKVRERAIGVQMDAVRQRVKMQEEGALIGRELQDAQHRLAEAEEMEAALKREKEEFGREKAAFRATTGGNVGTTSTHGIGTKHVAGGSTSTDDISSEVGDDIMGGRIKRRHKDRSQRQHLCSRDADLRDHPARPPSRDLDLGNIQTLIKWGLMDCMDLSCRTCQTLLEIMYSCPRKPSLPRRANKRSQTIYFLMAGYLESYYGRNGTEGCSGHWGSIPRGT